MTASNTSLVKAVDADDDGGFSVADFCERYHISTSQTYVEMAEGRLVAKKIGKRTIIPRTNARAWFQSLPDRKPTSAAA